MCVGGGGIGIQGRISPYKFLVPCLSEGLNLQTNTLINKSQTMGINRDKHGFCMLCSSERSKHPYQFHLF